MDRLNKVAQVTLLFWLMKIVATTLGETLGDYISMTLNLGYITALIITAVIFFIALGFQLVQKRYLSFYFWLVIIATTTLGTEISDFLDRTLGVGYIGGSAILLGGLLATLYLWYKNSYTLAVDNIRSGYDELYFWIAVLFSNSLGTAFGDFLSDVIGLSYPSGALVTAGVILLVFLIHNYTKVNRILLFWVAFIFTRPFGATFGDFLTKPLTKGGLDLGTLSATLVSVGVMGVLIWIAHKKEFRKISLDAIL